MGDVGLLNPEASKMENTKAIFMFLFIIAIMFLFGAYGSYLALNFTAKISRYALFAFIAIIFIEFFILRPLLCLLIGWRFHCRRSSNSQLVQMKGETSTFKQIFQAYPDDYIT